MVDVNVIDDESSLTISEVKALKKIAGYYNAGRVVLAITVGIGAVAMFLVSFADKASHFMRN